VEPTNSTNSQNYSIDYYPGSSRSRPEGCRTCRPPRSGPRHPAMEIRIRIRAVQDDWLLMAAHPRGIDPGKPRWSRGNDRDRRNVSDVHLALKSNGLSRWGAKSRSRRFSWATMPARIRQSPSSPRPGTSSAN